MVGEDQASSSRRVDRLDLSELVSLMGSQQTHGLLCKLETQLTNRFTLDPETISDRDRLASEAHTLVSAAGMLGCAELSTLCRRLEEACLTGTLDEDLLRKVRIARDEVLQQIALTCETLMAA